jgi:O-antigen biosynthesis protein
VQIHAVQGWKIFLCLMALSLGFAQISLAQSSVTDIRQAIQDGLYTYVAQVLGPEILEREPNNPEAHLLFAYALYYTGDVAQARLEFDKAEVLKIPPSSEVFHLHGLLKASQGDVNSALDLLQQAFEESQDYQIAMDWGRMAWEDGQTEVALEAFSQAAQTPFGQTQMWPELNRGRILHLTLKDYDAAIAAYDQAIQIFFDDNNPVGQASPGYVEAFFRLGQVYEALGDIDTAKSSYDAAIDVDANYLPALTALERLGSQ